MDESSRETTRDPATYRRVVQMLLEGTPPRRILAELGDRGVPGDEAVRLLEAVELRQAKGDFAAVEPDAVETVDVPDDGRDDPPPVGLLVGLTVLSVLLFLRIARVEVRLGPRWLEPALGAAAGLLAIGSSLRRLRRPPPPAAD